MGDSPLLEITLGLLFLFTLFSVLISAANEVIVGFFKSRSASLWDGILTLFNNDDNLRAQFFGHPLIKSLEPPKSIGWMLNNTKRNIPSYIEPRTFAVVLLDLLKNPRVVLEGVERELTHTLAAIRAGDTSGLGQTEAQLRKFAGQVDTTTDSGKQLVADIQNVCASFSTASTNAAGVVAAADGLLARLPGHQRTMLDACIKNAAPTLEGTLKTLADSAAGSIESLRDEIEGWFRQGMDGVSGWYKRWTQAVQFGLALLLAASVNVDVIRIAEALQADAQLRHATATQAVDIARNQPVAAPSVPSSDSQTQYKEALTKLNATTLPMGWEGNSVDYFYQHPVWVVFGWLIAAVAASFGAPFWFDLLKRVANLRGSEPNPDERKSKTRQT
jgi:hypothetical protein